MNCVCAKEMTLGFQKLLDARWFLFWFTIFQCFISPEMEPRNGNLQSVNKNQNPETGNWNAEIKENKFFRYAKIVSVLLSFLPLVQVRSGLSKKDLRLHLW